MSFFSNNSKVNQLSASLAEKAQQSDLDNVTKVLIPSGSGNDTSLIQNALNTYATVRLKSSNTLNTFMVDALTSINVPSNRKLLIDDDVTIQAIANNQQRYSIINLNGVQNVEIIGGTILGDRNTHTSAALWQPNTAYTVNQQVNANGYILKCTTAGTSGTTAPQGTGIGITDGTAVWSYVYDGEWGYGVQIQGSKHIRVRKTFVGNCWGDGIVISYDSKAYSDLTKVWYSEDILLEDCISDNNRRQGLSLITGKDIRIVRGSYQNTNGTAPQAGIDIEPDPLASNVPSGQIGPILEGIIFEDVKTKSNLYAPGILIDLHNINNTGKIVDINIKNHKDVGSSFGFQCMSVTGALGGIINVENPFWDKNLISGFSLSEWSVNAPWVRLINPVVKDANQVNNASTIYYCAFTIIKDIGSAVAGDVGNVTIINPSVISTLAVKPNRAFYINDRTNNNNLSKVDIIDPIRLDVLNSWIQMNGNVSDKYKTMVVDIANVSQSIAVYNFMPWYNNKSSTSLKTITVPATIPTGYPEIIFDNVSGQPLQIQPDATASILPLAPTAGKYIQSNTKGDRVVLRKLDATTYVIRGIIGNWTVQP